MDIRKNSSPWRLLVIMILMVIVVEAVVILLFNILTPTSAILEAIYHAIITVLLIFPILYIFSFRPLLSQVKERKRAEEALRLANENLELHIEDRTTELLAANLALQEEILEREKIEEQLGLRNLAIEAAANGIIIADYRGQILWSNPAFNRITGYSFVEVQGKTPRLLKSGQHDADFYDTLWQTISSGKVWHGEIINRHKDGSLFTAEQTITPVLDDSGTITHYIGIQQDISERKHAEQALEMERKRIFTVLDELPATVYLKDANYNIRYANHRFREYFGNPEGAPCYKTIFARDTPCEDCPTLTFFKDRRPQEWVQTFPDGRIFQLYDYPFIETDGTLMLLQLGIDITERKHIEARLEQMNRELKNLSRQIVEVQENERRYIARELHDEASQALTSLIVGLRLLEKDIDQSEAIHQRVVDLSAMVDGVQENLHRLAMDLRPASLDYLGLAAALRQYIDTLGEQSSLKIQMETLNLEERLPMEMETNLYRIIQEALANAMRHARASQVGILIERRDGKVIAIVEDNGIGFAPIPAMESGRLGLIGMRERAEMLGGKLVIESEPGRGTTLFVELPYDDPDSDSR